jgi:hypothetical protein
MEKNPNHTIELKDSKIGESQSTKIDNAELFIQDINENFLQLKKELIFFQDKSKIDEIVKNLDEGTRFLMLSEELDQEEILSTGIDFCIVADVSESMYPWRIFQKKSMYMALMDIESFFYKIPSVKPEDFSKVRFAVVKYSDRDQEKSTEVLDFVEYSSLEQICKSVDEIDIKKASIKKRAVFDGLKALGELAWREDSKKIILHYAADPQYGAKYTTNANKMSNDYDPFPEGCTDIDETEILSKVSDLNSVYNLVPLGERLVKFTQLIKTSFTMDVCKPKVEELNEKRMIK